MHAAGARAVAPIAGAFGIWGERGTGPPRRLTPRFEAMRRRGFVDAYSQPIDSTCLAIVLYHFA